MLRMGNIRSRIVLSTFVLVVLAIASMGTLAVWLVRGAVAESVRRDIERTVGLVERTGFLSSPNILEQISQFLKADVVSVNEKGFVLTSSLDPAKREAWETVLKELWSRESQGTELHELEIDGQPWTVGLTRLTLPDKASADLGIRGVALIYKEHRLSARQRAAQVPLIILTFVMLSFAMASGIYVARTVVKPLEQLAASAQSLGKGDFEARLDIRTGDEIETLSQSLTVMVENLRQAQVDLDRAEKLAALGRFAGALAHEVRTPLTSISMILTLEREKLEEGRSREALSLVLGEIEKLSLLSSKLLTFVRGPSVQLEMQALGPIIDEIMALLKGQFDHLGIHLKRIENETLPDLALDASAFRHVILNLTQNAMDAMPEGGTLTIQTTAKGGEVLLEIGDEGSGMEEAHRESVFEPFFTTKKGGTGLGLAITKAIVEAHRGKIDFRSGANGGTIFAVHLCEDITESEVQESRGA